MNLKEVKKRKIIEWTYGQKKEWKKWRNKINNYKGKYEVENFHDIKKSTDKNNMNAHTHIHIHI